MRLPLHPVQGEETAISLERWTLAAGGHIVAARTQVTTVPANLSRPATCCVQADLLHALCTAAGSQQALCMERHLQMY